MRTLAEQLTKATNNLQRHQINKIKHIQQGTQMKNIIFAASFLSLTACGGLNEALTKYGKTKPISYDIAGERWRIFDQPENNRLMITPSIGASARQGATTGLTFGMAGEQFTQREIFEPPAQAYLAARRCNITGGHLVVKTQFEFQYECKS